MVLVWAALLWSCRPKYSGTGSLTTESGPFQPTQCHVLGTRATGIALADDKGTSIEVTLPPAILDAFQEIGGPARATIITAGTPRDLGACSTLKMKGEGYHEPERRAASGTVSFACPGLTGEHSFSGCF